MANRTRKTAADLVSEFVESISKKSRAVCSGTARQARYYGSKRKPIALKLLAMGENGIREFATLLCHPSRGVRVDFDAVCARLRIQEWDQHPEHYDRANWA